MSDEEKTVAQEEPKGVKKFLGKALSEVDIKALKKIGKWREEE
jgi:hypothetical protein